MDLKKEILSEITQVIEAVEDEQVNGVLKKMTKSNRIFVVGEGRSGLQGKAFAMRLMHLGFTSFVVGETITPSIQEKDLLVAISGSGKTTNVLDVVKKAKKINVEVIGISSTKDSKLAGLASFHLLVPGATKNSENNQSIQLLSTLFDQSVHIVLDYICLLLSRQEKISNQDANEKHSNIE